jgi:hypothetical protein
MKVKLSQPRATNSGPEQIGDDVDVPDDEGRRMIARGQAKEVKPEKQGGNAQRQ